MWLCLLLHHTQAWVVPVRLLSLAMMTKLSHNEALIRGHGQASRVCPALLIRDWSLSLPCGWLDFESAFDPSMPMKWNCLKSLILSLGKLCPGNLMGLGYFWGFIPLEESQKARFGSSSHGLVCVVWVDPGKGILHQLVCWCRNPSLCCSPHLQDHPVTYEGSVALQLQDETARNYRIRNTDRHFQVWSWERLKSQQKRMGMLKNIAVGLLTGTEPMQVWGALCSGFILEVRGALYDSILPRILGFTLCACSAHTDLFLNNNMLCFLPNQCTKAILFLSKIRR